VHLRLRARATCEVSVSADRREVGRARSEVVVGDAHKRVAKSMIRGNAVPSGAAPCRVLAMVVGEEGGAARAATMVSR
jgi:hypothetical protein